MFALPKKQIESIEIEGNKDPFFNLTNDNEFPIRRYIEKKHGYAPSFFYSDEDFRGDVFAYMLKHGKLLSYTSVGKVVPMIEDTYKGLRGGTFWFAYKNIYIRVSMNNAPDESENLFSSTSFAHLPMVIKEEDSKEKEIPDNKTFSLTFAAPSNIQSFPIEDFKDFIVKDTKGKVHIFIKNQYNDYDFEPIKLETHDNMDLELNYGKKFKEIHETVTQRLTEKPSGLYMFHGAPGTGKTTYIKYLAGKINRDFIYIPTNMLEYFTTDPNSLSVLLKKPNSVLVLEDAEKAILKREGGGSNCSVSSLLNLSDGIMSDIMKTAIVLTYNCSKQDIDEALRRKGRLQVDYEFDLLSKEDATALAESLKYPTEIIEEEIKDKMSLADIYNLKTKVDFYEKKVETDRVIGFGAV
jgi:hypothetical protein